MKRLPALKQVERIAKKEGASVVDWRLGKGGAVVVRLAVNGDDTFLVTSHPTCSDYRAEKNLTGLIRRNVRQINDNRSTNK